MSSFAGIIQKSSSDRIISERIHRLLSTHLHAWGGGMETDTGTCSVYFTLIYLDDFGIMPASNACWDAWWRDYFWEALQK